MSQLSIEEADKLLTELILMRNKSQSSQRCKKKYNDLLSFCAQKFDYIVLNKVKKYKGFSNYEDLLQDGRVALVLAINSYNPDKGSFYYWANQYVKTKIFREANKHSSFKIPIKYSKTTQPYKVSFMPAIIDTQASIDSVEKDEIIQCVKTSIAKLPAIQRKIIEMSFGISRSDKSILKICEELGIQKNEFIKLLNKAKKSLKNDLLNEGV